jgi:cation transport ATPase
LAAKRCCCCRKSPAVAPPGLELCQEEDEESRTCIGVVVLQPRLRLGIAELLDTCKRLGVKLELLTHSGPASTQAISQRTGIPLTAGRDLPGAIRGKQQGGKFVALVADGAEAAAGFAACDLAIGMHHGRGGPFPARADLLAPDLHALVDLLEAAERQRPADWPRSRLWSTAWPPSRPWDGSM